MIEIGTLVKDRFLINSKLGDGRMAKTFLATDNTNNTKVVVKALQLKGLPEWKILELFEREANTLKSINHHNIPKYIDYFKEEKEDDIIYYLIYEYVDGDSLEELISKGYRFSYHEVVDIMIKVLEILKYLHSKTPPIIHRDINPNNIIMKSDKSIYLVDFGAVKILSTAEMNNGTTFIGTYGFIPLEQMTGEAYPQSDLYALGMTAIKLISGESPGKLPMVDLKPDYKKGESKNSVDRVIDLMIEPDINKRKITADDILETLQRIQHQASPDNNSTQMDDYPEPVPDKRYYSADEDVYVGDNYYEDFGRIKVQTFEDSITLVVISERNYNNLIKRDSPTDNLLRSSIRMAVKNSWILIILGIVALSMLRLPWFFYPILFIFGIPPITQALKKQYSEYEDVRIKFSPERLSVEDQLEPVKISKIKDIYIKKTYDKGKVNLKVKLKVGHDNKHFYISNLSEEEAYDVSNFIIRNVKARKELLA